MLEGRRTAGVRRKEEREECELERCSRSLAHKDLGNTTHVLNYSTLLRKSKHHVFLASREFRVGGEAPVL